MDNRGKWLQFIYLCKIPKMSESRFLRDLEAFFFAFNLKFSSNDVEKLSDDQKTSESIRIFAKVFTHRDVDEKSAWNSVSHSASLSFRLFAVSDQSLMNRGKRRKLINSLIYSLHSSCSADQLRAWESSPGKWFRLKIEWKLIFMVNWVNPKTGPASAPNLIKH